MNCTRKFGTTVACQHKRNGHTQKAASLQKGKIKECPKATLVKNGTCSRFEWSNLGLLSKKITNFQVQTVYSVQMFEFIFWAVSRQTFPPLFSHDLTKIIVPKRYYSLLTYEFDLVSEESVSAYHVSFATSQMPLNMKSGNLFQCSNDQVISSLSQCDGVKDCSVFDNKDEEHCHFQKSNESSLTKPTKCKIWYYSSHEGECHMYLFDSATKVTNYFVQSVTHSEIDNTVDTYLFGSILQGKGESKEVLEAKQRNNCEKAGQIKCGEESFLCYDVHEICTYKLNEDLSVFPCRLGENLEECKDFECNMMFKCMGYYCVPWSYVCNGRWDCPQGEDKFAVHQCQKIRNRNCQHLFKCKTTHTCISFGGVCDGSKDCTFGDDEFACSLAGIGCPSNCQCIIFVISCMNISANRKMKEQIISFYVVVFEFVVIHFDSWPPFKNLTKITLINCKIDFMFGFITGARRILSVEVTSSEIQKLGSSCCSELDTLITLILAKDKIQYLSHESFCNLPFLKLLNISGNALTQLFPGIFVNISRNIVIVFENNTTPLDDFDFFDSVGKQVFKTDDFHICCVIEVETVCLSPMPWFVLCSGLLPNMSVRIGFYLMSATILVLNLCSILCQHLSKKMNQLAKRTSNFHQIVITISAFDILSSVPLLLIWSVDLYFASNYIMKESNWRSSLLCFITFGLFIFVSFLSPFMLCLFSFMRYKVVRHPIRTQFKDDHFTKKIILLSVLCITVLSATSICLPSLVNNEFLQAGIPTGLCSPFLDPAGNAIFVKIFTWINSVLNFGSLVFITFSNVLLFRAIQNSQFHVRNFSSKTKDLTSLVFQQCVIVMSNTVCWIPSGVIFLTALYLKQYPVEMPVWTTICVSTINSLINPIVFIVTTLRKVFC